MIATITFSVCFAGFFDVVKRCVNCEMESVKNIKT